MLAAMHPAVDWPNGWEGGRVAGREEVRSYWAANGPYSIPRLFPSLSTTSPTAEWPFAYNRQ